MLGERRLHSNSNAPRLNVGPSHKDCSLKIRREFLRSGEEFD